jgi:hypothetical protein
VTDLSPSDAWVRAIVDRVSDGTYRSIISVKGFSGEFDSESSGFSLLASLKKAQRNLLNSIKDWKKHRFA